MKAERSGYNDRFAGKICISYSNGKLIVHTTFWDQYKYVGNFYYDLSKNALVRMAYGLSLELAADGIAMIPLSPGWMRTELVLESMKTDEEHWTAGAGRCKNTLLKCRHGPSFLKSVF